MVTIKRDYNSFNMKFSAQGTGMKSYAVKAFTSNEMALALNHYYGGENGHPCQSKKSCPLCRLVAKKYKTALRDD